jgi:hypothetical protein
MAATVSSRSIPEFYSCDLSDHYNTEYAAVLFPGLSKYFIFF